ncbi:hypothetical protein QLX08_000491 [Tetragonisca angustula]|uniref:Ribosomal protein L33 n=1 Tax=Tetragonisca angustula TaxID=166442 RepID=A0AAW1AJL7_9HYME
MIILRLRYCSGTTRVENRGGRIIATEEPESINPRKSRSHFKRFLRRDPSENYPRTSWPDTFYPNAK